MTGIFGRLHGNCKIASHETAVELRYFLGQYFFYLFFSGALLSRRKKTTRSLRALAQFKCMFNVDCI